MKEPAGNRIAMELELHKGVSNNEIQDKMRAEAKTQCARTHLVKRGHGEEYTTDPERVRQLLKKGWKIK